MLQSSPYWRALLFAEWLLAKAFLCCTLIGMTHIGFYQVRDPMPSTTDKTLAHLLEKVVSSGHRVLVVCPNAQRAERIDDMLWTYKEESFLPHGLESDGVHLEKQPILVTTKPENANGADVLVTVSGAQGGSAHDYTRAIDIFEGHENQVAKARERWKLYKDAGFELSYFEHTGTGWQKKA